MKFTGDIDIDVSDRNSVLCHFKHVKAMMRNKQGQESAHNVGIYVQDIPANPVTGRATFDYKEAEEIGYQKIDILNNSIYDDVINMNHLSRLCDEDMVRWDLLEDENIVNQMPHLNGHFDIVSRIRPRSVEDLAIILALIRPAKNYLKDETIENINKYIWEKPTDGSYHFKKSHSIGYALSLVVKLNLINETYDGT